MRVRGLGHEYRRVGIRAQRHGHSFVCAAYAYNSLCLFTSSPSPSPHRLRSFAHLVYNASHETGDHLTAIRLAKSRNAGHVYITNRSLEEDPYAGLPGPYIYWDQELRWAVNII